MSTREIDICFAPDEKLWRAVSKDMILSTGRVKGNKLRLQVSVARSSKGRQSPDASIAEDAPAKFNGIAEIEIRHARQVASTKAHCVVIDEPKKNYDEHALIAVITSEQPGALTHDDVMTACPDTQCPTLVTGDSNAERRRRAGKVGAGVIVLPPLPVVTPVRHLPASMCCTERFCSMCRTTIGRVMRGRRCTRDLRDLRDGQA